MSAGRWLLFRSPRGVLWICLGTEAVAVTLLVVLPVGTVGAPDWARFGTLAAVGIVQAELSLGIERIRRYFIDVPHINMTSAWTFGGAVVLPPHLAALLLVVLYSHLWARMWRPVKHRPAYRVIFSGSTVVLACLTVMPVLRAFDVPPGLGDGHTGFRTLAAIAVAALVYATVNTVPIAIAAKAHGPHRPFVRLLGTGAENALEFGTLCLGGLVGAVLMTFPALIVLLLLPVMVLHRNVLLRQLEEKAAQDSKTGLLNGAEWRTRLAAELARTERSHEPFGVLIIDLDRFKRVNDTYGHVAGDVVLRSVADTISAQLRPYDTVGRWGGEEFAVLLPEITETGAREVAERIRAAVATLEVKVEIGAERNLIAGLSVSVGVATYPAGGTTVDGLVHAADTAMYRAKAAGRNAVA